MIRYSILFFINREKDRDDAALRVRVKWDNQSCVVNIGYRINPDRWDSESHRCKPKSYHGSKKISSAIINKRIDEISEDIERLFFLSSESPSDNRVRECIRKETVRCGVNLIDAIDMFIKEESIANTWSDGTVHRMDAMRKHMKLFRPNAYVEEVTNEFMTSYLQWMNSKKMSNSYIKNEIVVVRWFVRWCKKKKMYSGNMLDEFEPKIKTIEKDVIFLTLEEINKLIEMDPGNKTDELIRDGFILQCFTGLRYSDLKNLKKSDTFDDHISIATIKTHDQLIIDLNRVSKAILDKYKDTAGVYAIRTFSNVLMNIKVKELCKKAGIDDLTRVSEYRGGKRVDILKPKYELITTHTGRKTFVVNAMYLGISDAVIMSWTGHSSVEAMKPYRKVVDLAKKRDMAKFDTISVTDVTKNM